MTPDELNRKLTELRELWVAGERRAEYEAATKHLSQAYQNAVQGRYMSPVLSRELAKELMDRQMAETGEITDIRVNLLLDRMKR